MKVIESISELKKIIKIQKDSGKSIGLVPTMGYLHDGHISLVKASKQDNDFTIISIFVNPTQFGPNEDFDKYPRNLNEDSKKAESAGVDLIFAPSVSEMYPKGFNTYVEVFEISEKLCGKSRPIHFKGVCTVVTKLFNIVKPDRAYFGQKDAQQVAIIKKMTRELNMDIEVIVCPIIREKDGLAMSSRNVYLNDEQRKAALILSRSLFEAENIIKHGEKNREIVLDYITKNIKNEKLADIDYIKIVNADTVEDVKLLEGKILIALAVRFGNIRLIDNIIVEV